MSKNCKYLQYDFHTGMCNTSSPVNIKVMFDQIKIQAIDLHWVPVITNSWSYNAQKCGRSSRVLFVTELFNIVVNEKAPAR